MNKDLQKDVVQINELDIETYNKYINATYSQSPAAAARKLGQPKHAQRTLGRYRARKLKQKQIDKPEYQEKLAKIRREHERLHNPNADPSGRGYGEGRYMGDHVEHDQDINKLFEDYMKEDLKSFFSLDPQKDTSLKQTAIETGLGFIPVVGQALAARDIERARRSGDKKAMASAAASMLPIGRLANVAGKARQIFVPATKEAEDMYKALEKAGKSPEEIYDATGRKAPGGAVHRNPWGQLKQETDDTTLFDPARGLTPRTGKASDVFNPNAEIFKRFPELKDIETRVVSQYPAPYAGKYTQGETVGKSKIWINQVYNHDKKYALDTAAHELQHAVQHATGGRETNANLIRAARDARDGFINSRQTAAQQRYYRNPAEIEARAAGARAHLTRAQKDADLPQYTLPDGSRVVAAPSISSILSKYFPRKPVEATPRPAPAPAPAKPAPAPAPAPAPLPIKARGSGYDVDPPQPARPVRFTAESTEDLNEMQLVGTDEYRDYALAMTPGQDQEIQDAFPPEVYGTNVYEPETEQETTSSEPIGSAESGDSAIAGNSFRSIRKKFQEQSEEEKAMLLAQQSEEDDEEDEEEEEQGENDGAEDGVDFTPNLKTTKVRRYVPQNYTGNAVSGFPVLGISEGDVVPVDFASAAKLRKHPAYDPNKPIERDASGKVWQKVDLGKNKFENQKPFAGMNPLMKDGQQIGWTTSKSGEMASFLDGKTQAPPRAPRPVILGPDGKEYNTIGSRLNVQRRELEQIVLDHNKKLAERQAAESSARELAKAELLKQQAAELAAKNARLTIIKSVLKRVPLVGAALGAALSIPSSVSRAKEGDYLGATGELASGIASIFPGTGTAASTAIDASLLARDIQKQRANLKESTLDEAVNYHNDNNISLAEGLLDMFKKTNKQTAPPKPPARRVPGPHDPSAVTPSRTTNILRNVGRNTSRISTGTAIAGAGAKAATGDYAGASIDAAVQAGQSAAAKLATKKATELTAQFLSKAAARKLPVGFGLAATGAGVADRLRSRDYLGAAGEGLSGVAGLFPLAGTTISAGIDAALLGRDLKNLRAQTQQKEKPTLSEAVDYHNDNNISLIENIFRPGSDMFFAMILEAKRLYAEGLYEPRDESEQDLLESDIGEIGEYNGEAVLLDFPFETADELNLNHTNCGTPNCCGDCDQIEEEQILEAGPGLWANIRAKRERIKRGSGERMRKPGEKGAPTRKQIQSAKNEEVEIFEESDPTKGKGIGKPFRSRGGGAVYVKNEKGNVIKVNFSQSGMRKRLNEPARVKSFIARHNCYGNKDRTSASYWACRWPRFFSNTGQQWW